MSLSTVRNKVVEKLGDMQSLNAVYDYPASNQSGKYPYATVSLRRGDGDMRSTAHNLRTRSFWIRVYQEKGKIGQGAEQSERIITDVIDELEEALDMDTTLSGTVKWCDPITWNASYRNREHDMRILEVQLNAQELVTAK